MLLNIFNFCLKYVKGLEFDIKMYSRKIVSYSKSKLFVEEVVHFLVKLQATLGQSLQTKHKGNIS